MRTRQFDWKPGIGLSWQGEAGFEPDFVLYFGSRALLSDPACYDSLRQTFPHTALVGCSTGGQFDQTQICDDRVLAVAVGFHESRVRLASVEVRSPSHSAEAGAALGRQLAAPDLRAMLVFSDGLSVNGTALVAGLQDAVSPMVTISGGLAGDGAAFERTLVGANAPPASGCVVAIGLYGDHLSIQTGHAGGWTPFGPRRVITRSQGNLLQELDGRPAFELYRRYLDEEDLRALPGSALLFPLRIEPQGQTGQDVVRTILSIDQASGEMTFAGDMPQGWSAQLMRGNSARMAQSAAEAMRQAQPRASEAEGLALLVSCIGRRLLMGQRAVNEVEAAAEAMAVRHALIGFYSYGEISPHAQSGFAQLHNQTMTVVTVSETSDEA
ncbi:MAG: FIST C-terminal domain-containing protein [Beijerinckiaceae bacterium]|nr:FIST C-terminal domain-containing protein [Beijerinckiaceae bacterium]